MAQEQVAHCQTDAWIINSWMAKKSAFPLQKKDGNEEISWERAPCCSHRPNSLTHHPSHSPWWIQKVYSLPPLPSLLPNSIFNLSSLQSTKESEMFFLHQSDMVLLFEFFGFVYPSYFPVLLWQCNLRFCFHLLTLVFALIQAKTQITIFEWDIN